MSQTTEQAEDHTRPKWFDGEPKIIEKVLIPVQQSWQCPCGCGGQMIATGMYWPMSTPGYWHKCNKCEYMAVPRGGVQYPRIVHVPEV